MSSKSSLIFDLIWGTVCLAGIVGYCAYNEANKVAPGMYVSTTKEDVYICVYDEELGRYTLHEGDVRYLKDGYSRFAVGLDSVKFDFNCGKSIISNSKFSIHEEKPSSEHYQEVCKDCFKDEHVK